MKNFVKFIIIFFLILTMQPIFANEIDEDYLDIASDYCVIGDYNSAVSYLDKIIERNPNSSFAKNLRSGLLHIISNDKKSYVINVSPYIKQAMESKRVGDEQSELDFLLNATQEKNSYLADYFLGDYYRKKHNLQKAVTYYNNSLSANPNFAQVYLALGITLIEMGKYDSALNPLDKYLTFNPEDDLAYSLKARAEIQLREFEGAKIDNEKAITLNNCPEYQFDKAKIMYLLGDYSGAKNLFLSLLPEIQMSKIYEYIAYCDIELGNYSDALLNIDRAFILSDDDEYLNNKYNEIKSMMENKED